ncbi:MAG: RHS repeat-associated core domain-containing protein [Ruminococcaceae bacterium]|nr:RHS repeat-associated core domain-containing protein [Oscillospiraceae bacterium]
MQVKINQILLYVCLPPVFVIFHDAWGNPVGMRCFQMNAAGTVISDNAYFYATNAQGDVIAIYDENGVKIYTYAYDAWGNLIEGREVAAGGAAVGALNPLRYRGYYYDAETGLYYVSSRYYDPEICRWINADNQLSAGSDLTGMNLFAYCGNNPVNRIDPTGEAWWHWALGAAVVAVAAVATVVTCGGFAAAATAVCMVGSGVAAATTASTVAAGAFIGSATVYGMAVLFAASTSSSAQEFNDQGNWGTVAATAFGGLTGGYAGYTMSKAQTPTSTPTNTSRGSTGRTEPANLREQLAMEQVKSNPSAGTQLTRITLNDPRWPSSEGWVKMQQIVPTSQGDINIHYVYNQTLKIFDDFKFKS